jgi:beta-glucosidase-like glycosyl hydrolase
MVNTYVRWISSDPEALHASVVRAGSVLSGGGSVPAKNAPPEAWVKMVNGMQSGALSTRLGIPIIYGIDAVHGHGNVYKATIFPHNIGLGCTRYVRTCASIVQFIRQN